MFISSYTGICFFVKKLIFFDISVNKIFECLYLFFGWERGHQLSTYAIGVGMESHPKCIQLCTGGGGVTPHVT